MWEDFPSADDLEGAPERDERVLVAVITRPRDWARVQAEHWYRIPAARAPRRITAGYLAFYHTASFPELRFSIAFYAPILRYHLAHRRDLLPDEPQHPRAGELYYRLDLGPLEALPHPIPSRKLRRVTFIRTTLSRLLSAQEINELWEREVARDRLWRALQTREIHAQRGYLISDGTAACYADLTIPCLQRNLAIVCVPLEGEGQREGPALDLHGWGWQRFRVAEIMGDLSTCVESVCLAVAAQGGYASHSASAGADTLLGSPDKPMARNSCR